MKSLIIAKEHFDWQPAIATDLESFLNAVQRLDLVVCQVPAVKVEVGLDARFCHTLGQHAEALLQAPLDQYLLR